jgi:hypothetical protein
MRGKCMIVLSLAILLASAAAASARGPGLLLMGAEWYLQRAGAEWYLDSNGHRHSIRSDWAGIQGRMRRHQDP